jgi:hypothetical protein
LVVKICLFIKKNNNNNKKNPWNPREYEPTNKQWNGQGWSHLEPWGPLDFKEVFFLIFFFARARPKIFFFFFKKN